jgi:hypothetical protein
MLQKFINILKKSPVSRLFADDPIHLTRKNLDILLAAILLKTYSWNVTNKDNLDNMITKDLFSQFSSELDSLRPRERELYVQKEINKQMIGIFQKYSKVAPPKSINQIKLKDSDIDIIPKIFSKIKFNPKEETYPSLKSNCLLDFELKVRKSTIPNAGKGLFLKNIGKRKSISPGSVIAIFPGVVHLYEYVKNVNYIKNLFPDPNYLLMMRSTN